MKSPTRLVPILVTLFMNFAFLPKAQAHSLGLSLRLAGANIMVQPSNPATIFGGSLNYTFYKTVGLSIENSYASPFRQFDNYFKEGINDIGVQLSDQSLLADKALGLNLSGRMGVLFPVSMASRESSMRNGFTAGLALKKSFGEVCSLTYSVAGDLYEHDYMTASETEDGDGDIYNTRADLSNRLSFVYNLLKAVHLQIGSSMAMYYSYADTVTNIYSLGSSIALDLAPGASVDIGFRTSMKDPHAPRVWGGPAAAPQFFEPEGTVMFFGTSIEI